MRRIFGEGGTVRTVCPIDKTPEQLIAEIRIYQPTAIFLEATAPPHSKAVRALANGFLVLEPVFKEQKAYRDGLPSRKVVGIGRRNERGEVEALPDGALKKHGRSGLPG